MDLLQLLILLVIAGICGAIAEWIIGFSPGGFLTSIIVGVIGAYLGGLVANALGFPSLLAMEVGTRTIDLIYTVLGSALFLLILVLLRGRRRPIARRFSRS